jgi:hypothetical protein
MVDVRINPSFRGGPFSFFVGSFQAFLAEPLKGGLLVTLGFNQSFLAIHHAGPGLGPQGGNSTGSNGGHIKIIRLIPWS